jgi:PAS domain S-box-containing protein
MEAAGDRTTAWRVLHVPPTARDGQITAALLAREGMTCTVCGGFGELADAIEAGAGAVLLTDEALVSPGFGRVIEVLASQPAWSDLPIVMLLRVGAEVALERSRLRSLHNVTLLPRPAPARSVVSAISVALRARGRQYQIRDQIEEIRQAEARLRESDARFHAMADAIPQLAWMARPDGAVFWFNQRWFEYTGCRPEECEGFGWMRVHDPGELPRVLSGYRAAIRKGEAWEDTFPLRRYDGEFRWHLSRAEPFRDEAGAIQLWFGTNTDITEGRRAIEERERALQGERAARSALEQAARMKDEFLATLSHELRTPLNAILGWSSLIRRSSAPDSLEPGLAAIERNARVQVQLIEDLLDMSRITSGKLRLNFAPVDPISFVQAAVDTIAPAARAKGLDVRTVLRRSTGPVNGDSDRLQQVVWNLLSNAVKFGISPGSIDVTIDGDGGHVTITVADTGPGIDPRFLPYVFDRFRQADASSTRVHRGLGLGLAIVRHLVEAHGGWVTAANGTDRPGALFTVTLPVASDVPPIDAGEDEVREGRSPAAAPAAPAGARLRGVTVLFVDDEPDARVLGQRILEESGARVRVAASADEAMAVLATETPDVIVSDLAMPGKDGYTLLRQVRAMAPAPAAAVPAIALSAFAREEDRARALGTGYRMHLAKPIEPDELVTAVDRAAGGAARTPREDTPVR